MSNVSTTTLDPTVVSLNIARANVQRYGQPLLFAVGIVGCVLNIGIFLRPTMRQNSCAIYFHACAWANLFCLCWGVLASMLAFFTNNNPAAYNVFYCKFRFYMINFAQYASRAFVVLACLDRYCLCSASARQRLFCRATVAWKVVALAVGVSACLAVYILITYNTQQRVLPCMAVGEAASVYETISFWMFTFIIPTVSISVLSWLTMRRLKINARRVGREKISVAGKDMQLSAMLIAQVVLYLVTNVPYISLILYGKITENIPSTSKSAYRLAVESFANTFLASFFYYVYNGWSFFVYTLTAPSFRRELVAMIVPRRWLRKGVGNAEHITMTRTHRIHPGNGSIAMNAGRRTTKGEQTIDRW